MLEEGCNGTYKKGVFLCEEFFSHHLYQVLSFYRCPAAQSIDGTQTHKSPHKSLGEDRSVLSHEISAETYLCATKKRHTVLHS
ncbi:hypothetical protein NPIL_310261 [Nephila pilipes]|uniref:Uncharacterized protein n=1 Tax=Nephila pilipes TaxID=299642 RepID=A0A8X6TUK5_NEPPI|nr:hypothetical protein NPIL_310261 [Nephila pilipes]